MNNMSSESAIGAEYASSLADLTVNSKPLINMLTILAEENIAHATVIAQSIQNHLMKVRADVKLPVLYLVDSIVKNVRDSYVTVFAQCIVNMFCGMFEKVDEHTRSQMYKLRQTWNTVFPAVKLYALDVRVNCLDPAWPITAAPPTGNIHVNPNFLKKTENMQNVPVVLPNAFGVDPSVCKKVNPALQTQLFAKQREILELERKKLELQLEVTKRCLDEQAIRLAKQQLTGPEISTPTTSPGSLYAPDCTSIPISPAVVSTQEPSATAYTNTSSGGPLISARISRDPRLARRLKKLSATSTAVKILETNVNDIHPNKTESQISMSFDCSRSSNVVDHFVPKNAVPINANVEHSLSDKLPHIVCTIPVANLALATSRVDNCNSENVSDNCVKLPVPNETTVVQTSITKSATSSSNIYPTSAVSSTAIHDSQVPNGLISSNNEVHPVSDNISPHNLTCDAELIDKDMRISGDQVCNLHMKNDPTLHRQQTSSEPDKTINGHQPVPVETSLKNELTENSSLKDVDLRTLPPPVVTNGTNTKRVGSSADVTEQPLGKKIKVDLLFGEEDVDLRSLGLSPISVPKIECKSPKQELEIAIPPPPIISYDLTKENLEIVRLKLAEATKLKEEVVQPILIKIEPDNQVERLRTIAKSMTSKEEFVPRDCIDNKNDVDNRRQTIEVQNRTAPNANLQYNDLVQQIALLANNPKLFKAQYNSTPNPPLEDLTPISDDELRVEPENNISSVELTGVALRQSRLVRTQIYKMDQDRFSDQLLPNLRPDCVPWKSSASDQGNNQRDKHLLYRQLPRYHHSRLMTTPLLGRHIEERFRRPMFHGPVRFDRFNRRPIQSEPILRSSPNAAEKRIDSIRTVYIDGIPREIRYYNDTSIVMMDHDDPREIGFQEGCRRITFDDRESFVMGLNQPYQHFLIDGIAHRVKFGSPTRELYIDGKWFECLFGGPPLRVNVDGHSFSVKTEGPAPEVRLGPKRLDLCAGRVFMMVDAKTVAHVFLDTKPQEINVEGTAVTIRFSDALGTVFINDFRLEAEFGGPPRLVRINGNKHYVQFTSLPGNVNPAFNNNTGTPNLMHGRDSPVFGLPNLPAYSDNKEHKQEDIDPGTPHADLPISTGNVDVDKKPDHSSSSLTVQLPVNVDQLFKKLVASGIVSNLSKSVTPEPRRQAMTNEVVKPVSFNTVGTLKIRQAAFIKALYCGMQCSSCGARFLQVQTMKYSQHLDWHFRQNRQERDATRKVQSRKWYYTLSDWVQYQEIEDLEEREKSWFENQQDLVLDKCTTSMRDSTCPPSVPTRLNETDASCYMCHDRFEQYYNEEKEEWHLRMAIRIEDNTYHPLCYEDYKRSLFCDESSSPDVNDDINGEKLFQQMNENSADSHPHLNVSNAEDNKCVILIDEECKIEDSDEDVEIKETIIDTVTVDDEEDSFEDVETVVKIKQEPEDIDAETDVEMTDLIASVSAHIPDNSQIAVISSIDGNVKHEPATDAGVSLNKIKINISKVTTSNVQSQGDNCANSETVKLKPGLQNADLAVMEPVTRGTEMSGLCSIM